MHTSPFYSTSHCFQSKWKYPITRLLLLWNYRHDCYGELCIRWIFGGTWKVLYKISKSTIWQWHFSRLFYLYQDSVEKYIEEESLFACLSCIHYVFSGIAISIMIGEVYLNSNESHTSFFGYSSCSKVPWGEEAWSYDMQMVTGILIICITFGLNIALFVRKRQLETIREEGIMVVHYSHDGVTISRRKEDEPSSRKLRNFNRTVVTPKASFILFLTNALDYFILTFIHSSLPLFGELVYFLTFSYIFFFNTLIETIFSPCLRNSIIDIFPCRRPAYAVTV